MEWDYDFTISGMTEEQAQELLAVMVEYAEKVGAFVAGGFILHQETGDEIS